MYILRQDPTRKGVTLQEVYFNVYYTFPIITNGEYYRNTNKQNGNNVFPGY